MSQIGLSHEGLCRSASRSNRRVSIRYRCAPATVGKIISANDQEFQRAWIIDLSLTGMGMEVSRPLEPGHLIIVTIRSTDGSKTHELSASVMHCDLSLQGSWYVGCALTVPLSRDELDQLL